MKGWRIAVGALAAVAVVVGVGAEPPEPDEGPKPQTLRPQTAVKTQLRQ